MPEQLAEAAELPAGLAPLWRDFLDLHHTRGSTGVGPARITYGEIEAMQRSRGVVLAPWEIEAIKAADSAFFEYRAEMAE